MHALLLLALMLPERGAMAEPAAPTVEPATGLLWVRNPLPSVFPLQVRTRPGHGYYLTLLEAESGAETLAAYIRGGDFFRVLVPPGSYRLRVSHGAGWRGEEALFGPGTSFWELDTPLRFATRGIGTKAGHLVDLRDLIETRSAAMVRPLALCQRQQLDFVDVAETAFAPGARFTPPLPEGAADPPRLVPRLETYARICG